MLSDLGIYHSGPSLISHNELKGLKTDTFTVTMTTNLTIILAIEDENINNQHNIDG